MRKKRKFRLSLKSIDNVFKTITKAPDPLKGLNRVRYLNLFLFASAHEMMLEIWLYCIKDRQIGPRKIMKNAFFW